MAEPTGRARPSGAAGRPPTAQQAVLDDLRQAIWTRELRPGDRIRQDEIAARFGVSRVPVREALKILQAEGQVEYQPHRGYSVRLLTASELDEVFSLRMLLEDEAIRHAVARIDVDRIDQLGRIVDEMGEAGAADDYRRYLALNRDFHLQLFAEAGRPQLYRHIEMLWQTAEPYRSRVFADAASRRRADRDHRAILAAIRRRDIEAAVELMRHHRDQAMADLAALDGSGAKDAGA